LKEKEIKELKEKDIRDIKLKEIGGYPHVSAGIDVESRITELEHAVTELTHFISSELRPDLQTSALNQEDDLMLLSQQLKKQADDAKLLKDDKDIEKLREI
jgi:hypothetical protein